MKYPRIKIVYLPGGNNERYELCTYDSLVIPRKGEHWQDNANVIYKVQEVFNKRGNEVEVWVS